MDHLTLRYYSQNAQAVATRYESIVSALSEHFVDAFARHSRILDIGCGSGRDLAQLAASGYQAYGVDPVEEFVCLAQSLHPELEGRVTLGGLPDLGVPFGGEFDGILCSAVLMHLPEMSLPMAAAAIRGCLAANGRLLVSVPTDRSDVKEAERDQNGRLFRTCTPNALDRLFDSVGFEKLAQWSNADSLGRDGIRWSSLLYQVR